MLKKIDLLIIDPQKDFCDPQGALFVPGADQDMSRLTKMVNRIGSKLNDIHVTLDSHHVMDIAHPMFWKDSSGSRPAPFTIITKSDIDNGNWSTTIPSFHKRASEYVALLETNGRYPLCIWPEHCLIGSEGHAVVPELFEALKNWERNHSAMVDYVSKGSNIHTEHYSGVQADVPDPSDPSTQINVRLIKTLEECDTVLIAGEALSHCLANTTKDIVDNFSDSSYVKKIVLLEDASSSVGSFETLGSDFVKDMVAKGMQISNTEDFLK